MNNFSEVTSFYLSDYYGTEGFKLVYFGVSLIIYIIIVAENTMLIAAIYCEKTLHGPMYVLLCNLSVNGLYGSTALLPAVLINLMSKSYEISLPFCLTQIYAVHTYASIEFTILAVMSYDRYVAICYPLLYHRIVPQRIVKLVVFTWLYPMLAFIIVLMFTFQLRFCERTITHGYCLNYYLVKLACTDTTIASIMDLLITAVCTLPSFIMIFYSYAHILRICVSSYSTSKPKALRTCTPHILAVVNYTIGCFFDITKSRFNISYLPDQVKLFLSLYFLVLPSILNPAIYGLSIRAIRSQLLRIFSRKSSQVTNNVAKRAVAVLHLKCVMQGAEASGNT